MGHGKDIRERAERMNDPDFLDEVVGRCSGLSYTYREYVRPIEGLAEQPGPAIGDRAPDADLDAGATLFDLTRHTSYTLAVLRAAEPANPPGNETLDRLRQRFEPVLRIHEVPGSPEVARHYGSTPYDRVVLIRPDGYLAFHGAAEELPLLESYLASSLTV